MQLKLISLNLAGFKHWESRRQKIVTFLNTVDSDVILMQEVRFDPLQSPYDQASLLNQSLVNEFPYRQITISRFYQPSIGEAYREGLAILSKYPIKTSEVLALNKQPDDKHARIIQNVNITVGKQELLLTNVHFSNNQHSVEQLREVLRIMRARNEKRIIAGDFNILNLKKERDVYEDKYVASIDFKEYMSFPSEGITLDYALIPKKYSVVSLEIEEGVSDHNALLFTVSV